MLKRRIHGYRKATSAIRCQMGLRRDMVQLALASALRAISELAPIRITKMIFGSGIKVLIHGRKKPTSLARQDNMPPALPLALKAISVLEATAPHFIMIFGSGIRVPIPGHKSPTLAA